MRFGAITALVCSVLVPVAAKSDRTGLLLAVRVISGVGEGMTAPAFNAMLGRWVSGCRSKSPLATENLLENTDGVLRDPHNCFSRGGSLQLLTALDMIVQLYILWGGCGLHTTTVRRGRWHDACAHARARSLSLLSRCLCLKQLIFVFGNFHIFIGHCCTSFARTH